MKQINEYINENINHNLIEEGKIWNAIKSFFKKIFEPNDNYYLFKYSNKKYDRFKNDGEYIAKHDDEFKKYIENNFTFECVSVGIKKPEKVQEIINIHDKLNFTINENHKYYIGYFIDRKTKDICFIIGTNPKGDIDPMIKYNDDCISLSSFDLDSNVVCSKICSAFENTWDIL